MSGYARPGSLDEALDILAGPRGWRVLAGGTDLYPGLGDALRRADLLDITGLSELRGITPGEHGYRIGALTTWSEIAAADLPPFFDALRQSAREVGSVQIQNVATVAGNVVNASPAADGTVALMALGAEVEIAGPDGARRVPIGDFVTGVRAVALGPGELVTALTVPDHGARARSHFLKLGARRYLVISIAMAAVMLRPDAQGRIADAGVAVGACAPVARRLTGLEARLRGAAPGECAARLRDGDAEGLAPIDDVRAPARYRAEAVPVLLRRCLEACDGAHDGARDAG